MATSQFTENPLDVPRYRDLAYHIALGKTQREAMALSGVRSNETLSRVLRDERVLAFVQRIRKEQMENLDITRDDVLRGFLSAIADAKTLGEPSSQIAGWREIGKFQGQYAPEEVTHKISGRVEHVTRRIRDMPDDRLLDLLDRAEKGEDVIDIEEGEWEDITINEPASSARELSPPTPSSSGSRTSKRTPAAASAKPKQTRKSSARNATSGGSRKPKSGASAKQSASARSTGG